MNPEREDRGRRLTFSGRVFSQDELELMRQIAADCAGLGVTEIARTVCELIDWKRPSGRLKNHECRQLLEHLRDRDWLRLPAIGPSGPRGPRRIGAVADKGDPSPQWTGSAGQYMPFDLQIVEASTPDSRLWMELVERHHYLAYRVPVGANLRYLVRWNDQILACLLWTSPAWKMAVRDRWIGWTSAQRQCHLQHVVNNGRFLILPSVRVKGLASAILARCARQLPLDWERRYGIRPLLLETCVDSRRFRGTCYRAANWILLGATRGRGRMDRLHQAEAGPKLVFVYPLHHCCQPWLCLGVPVSPSTHIDE